MSQAPTIEDLRAWLVEQGQSVSTVRAELRSRGLTPQAAGQLIARALRSLSTDDDPEPLALRRARLRHAAGAALARGDWRGYRALSEDLEALQPVDLELPADLSVASRRELLQRAIACAIEGKASPARLAQLRAMLADATQIDYAEAAGRAAAAAPDEQAETPTTLDELARAAVTLGQR